MSSGDCCNPLSHYFVSISIVGLSDFNRFLNPLFCFGFGLFRVNVGLGAPVFIGVVPNGCLFSPPAI